MSLGVKRVLRRSRYSWLIGALFAVVTLFVVFSAVFCQGRVSVGFCNLINKIEATRAEGATTESTTSKECKDGISGGAINLHWTDAVSYTHLPLQTNREV